MSLKGNASARKIAGKINKLDVIYTDTYEIAVKNGFDGTIDEWLATLKGDTPIKGVDYWTEEDIEEIKSGLNETVLGDIETALDTIIAIQEELINNGGGGDNTCPNCGEALDSDGYCPNYCHEMESAFYVNGSPYYFYAGMTWEDFINSGYNKIGTCEECGSENKQFDYVDDIVSCFTGNCCNGAYAAIYRDPGYSEMVSLYDEIEAECDYFISY